MEECSTFMDGQDCPDCNHHEKEIKKLKKACQAYERLLVAYRTGDMKIPDWVIDTIEKTKKRYGNKYEFN